jgi:hypothetical protein
VASGIQNAKFKMQTLLVFVGTREDRGEFTSMLQTTPGLHLAF